MSIPIASRAKNAQRRFYRVSIPLGVTIGERTYRVRDWSLGGFSLNKFRGLEGSGAELDGHLTLPYDDFSLKLPIRFRVVWRNQRTIGCEFIELRGAARRALRHLLEATMEGRLDDVDGVLAAIDAPVPSDPLEELLEEENETHVRIGTRQLIRKTSAYAVLGLGAIALLAGLVWRNATVIDIPAGTVMGNFVSVASRADGRLSELLIREGQPVQVGQMLFSLSNSDLEEAVAVERAELAAARARRASLEQQLLEEQRRVGFYVQVTEKQLEQATADLNSAEARLDHARIDRLRVEDLHAEGLAPAAHLDLALRQEKVVAEEIRALRKRIEIAELNVLGAGEGRFFGGQEIEGRLIEIREQLHVAEAGVLEAEKRLDATITRLQETRVQAPVDGVVYTIYRQPGEVLHPRDVVLSLQVDEGYWAVGRLPEDDAVRVRPGLPAVVVIPSYDLRLDGVVSAVGHQALSTASQSSADMESALSEVPIKIQLLDAGIALPPGLRARIRIRTGFDSAAEAASAIAWPGLWPRREAGETRIGDDDVFSEDDSLEAAPARELRRGAGPDPSPAAPVVPPAMPSPMSPVPPLTAEESPSAPPLPADESVSSARPAPPPALPASKDLEPTVSQARPVPPEPVEAIPEPSAGPDLPASSAEVIATGDDPEPRQPAATPPPSVSEPLRTVEPPVEPAVEPAVPAPETGDYEVQLAAMRVEDNARRLARDAERRLEDLAARTAIEVREAKHAGETVYRVVLRPAADAEDARSLCEIVETRGLDCFVRRVTSEEAAQDDRPRS